jgi:hypothetical protein
VHALGDQFEHAVLDQILRPQIGEATRQRPTQPEAQIDLAQEQHPTVAAEPPTAKISHDFACT